MRWFITLVLSASVLFAAGELSNRRAPGFALMDVHQNYHDPQDYRGKTLVVEFMQTGCVHCQKFSTILEQAKAKYGDKLAVLYVVTAPDSFQMVQDYISKFKITSPVLFDSGQVMASYLKITPQNPTVEFPHAFLVDGNGWIKNDFKYGTATEGFFEGKGLFTELDKMIK
jgi:thiol-disulfide isomerase/thioredoxin